MRQKKFRRLLALNCSLFFYFFLIFFQPFGVNNYQPHSVFSLELILGILPLIPVVFLTITLCEKFMRPLLINRFHIREIAWYAVEFFIIGSMSFFLYNALGNFHDFHLKSYVFHLLEVSSILIFPFGATLFYFRFIHLKKDYEKILSVAEEESKLDDLLHLSGDYKRDSIALKPKQIIYLSSEDNYVELNYIQDNEVKKYLIRSTLSGIESSLDLELFKRCHRSYVINIAHVESIRKAGKRLLIKMNMVENEIPVSRSYQKQILDRLEPTDTKL